MLVLILNNINCLQIIKYNLVADAITRCRNFSEDQEQI